MHIILLLFIDLIFSCLPIIGFKAYMYIHCLKIFSSFTFKLLLNLIYFKLFAVFFLLLFFFSVYQIFISSLFFLRYHALVHVPSFSKLKTRSCLLLLSTISNPLLAVSNHLSSDCSFLSSASPATFHRGSSLTSLPSLVRLSLSLPLTVFSALFHLH